MDNETIIQDYASRLVDQVEILVKQRIPPDVYYNGHMAFMDEDCALHNERLVDKYFYRIRNL